MRRRSQPEYRPESAARDGRAGGVHRRRGPWTSAVLAARRGADPDRAGDAGAAEPAVAVRVLREVLLVVVLGVVEVLERRDLGRDLVVAAAGELALEHAPRRLGRLALSVRRRVDRRPVLGADVVALAHALRRVVVLPEQLQDRLVARLLRVEDHQHDLRVAGLRGADFLVRRVRGVAARVAGRGRVDAGRLPEDPLRAPEAAHAEHRLLETVRERRRYRRAEHVVTLGDAHRLLAAGQRIGGVDHLRLVAGGERAWVNKLATASPLLCGTRIVPCSTMRSGRGHTACSRTVRRIAGTIASK